MSHKPKHRKKADPRRMCLTCEHFKPTGREQHGPGYITAGLCLRPEAQGVLVHVHAGLACRFGFEAQPQSNERNIGGRFHALP